VFEADRDDQEIERAGAASAVLRRQPEPPTYRAMIRKNGNERPEQAPQYELDLIRGHSVSTRLGERSPDFAKARERHNDGSIPLRRVDKSLAKQPLFR
jgi:hypothetical protein